MTVPLVKWSHLQVGYPRVEEPSKLHKVLRAVRVLLLRVCVDVLLVREGLHFDAARGGQGCFMLLPL